MTDTADDLAGLQAVAADAAALEPAALDPAAVHQAAAIEQTRTECAEVVQLVADLALPLLAMRWPWITIAYGPEQQARIADSLAQVASRRGWSVSSVMAGYGAEIALGAALLGPALPHMLQAAQKPRQAPAQVVASAPSEPPPAPPAPQQAAGLDGRVL